nr:ParB N-terminal domain-containing protein [Pseudoflavonifractor phocaeensis]
MENGILCVLPLKQLDGFPGHEEHFPLYTGQRLADMVDSIRRLGVQTPILVWKTSNGLYIIISGHNRVNASILAGCVTIPAVVRTDLTMETAEDLFFEMNFRQRSLADMLFSQRVLCVAAHYNMLKRQGRRTDLLAAGTSPDTQEKSHTDKKIAQEYELTRDKVSKYCRYATLYRPLLLLMDTGKQLGQLAAYEVSFVEDHDLQECIYQHISTGKSTLSTAKGKKLRTLFEAGNLDVAQIKAILTEETTTAKRPGRRISVTLSADFESYFPKKATAKEIEETIQKALELYFKTTKSSL